MHIVYLLVAVLPATFCFPTEEKSATTDEVLTPVLNLCDFSSHNDFIAGLEDMLREDVTRALLFAHEHSLVNKSDFVETLSSSEYTVLQILYALISGDEAYAKLTAQLAFKVDTKDVKALSVWIKENFRFKRENLYEGLRNYVDWNMDGESTRHLTELILLITKDFSLEEVILSQNDSKTLDWLSGRGYKIKRESKADENPPLHGAAERGDLPGVKDLLGKGAKVNCTGRDGSTPLHKAAFWGHLNVLRELLSFGANVNCTDRSGETPLCWAVNGRHLSVIDELLGRGACVNCSDKRGRTPLHSAAWWGNLPIVRELLDFGADVNKRDEEGHTPLYMAQQMFCVDVAKFLKSMGGKL